MSKRYCLFKPFSQFSPRPWLVSLPRWADQSSAEDSRSVLCRAPSSRWAGLSSLFRLPENSRCRDLPKLPVPCPQLRETAWLHTLPHTVVWRPQAVNRGIAGLTLFVSLSPRSLSCASSCPMSKNSGFIYFVWIFF